MAAVSVAIAVPSGGSVNGTPARTDGSLPGPPKRRRTPAGGRPAAAQDGRSRLMAYVEDRLRERWSPEQIAGRLAAQPPADLEGCSISHTTIYRSIWSDPERVQEFRPFLRIASKPRAQTLWQTFPPGPDSRANAPLTSVPPKPTNAPAWAIGKAIPSSVEASGASF